MFLFPPQTAKMNHVKPLLYLQFPLPNGFDLWTKDEIVQDTERRILELMHKAESERRARFSVQKAETTSKQPAANACLHTTALPTSKAKSRLVFYAKPWRTAKTPETLKGVMSSRKAWLILQSASSLCSNRKPNAGLNLTTGRRLLVPPQAAQHV